MSARATRPAVRLRLGALVIALATVTAACGSTVQTGDTATGQPGQALQPPGAVPVDEGGYPVDAAGDPLGQPADGTAPTGNGVPAPTGTTDPGTPDVPTGTAPTDPPGTQPPAPDGKGPTGSATGVTADSIKVGIISVQGFTGFASSVGLSVQTGDQRAQATAVIKRLNDTGGIAGRKVVPVFYDLSVAGLSSNPSAEYQAACTALTQDDKVYAVASPVGTIGDGLYTCLQKAGVPTISAGESVDADFFKKFADTFYMPSDMNLTRILRDNTDALFAAGFFGKDAKVGVVLTDTATEKAAVDKGLKPALAAHGLKLVSTFAASTGTSGVTQYSNAVLQFRTQGVTHVMFSYGGSALLFGQNASQQGYYPRYALHSRQSPAALLQGALPARVLKGSMGIGWQQYNDVDNQRDPGPTGLQGSLCLKLLKDAGQDTSSRSTALIGLWQCDNLFFLREALQGAPDFTLAGFRAGAESVSKFAAASTFRSGLKPGGLHDGVSAYRLFAFDDGCACFSYTSPVRSSP